MKNPASSLAVLAALTTSLLTAGCIGGFVPPDPIGRALFRAFDNSTDGVFYEPREAMVYHPMPAPRWERRPYRPDGFRDPVFIDGHWAWTGADWAWNPGRWVERPRPGYRWVRPDYVRYGDGWRWRSGYWRRF